MSTEEEQPEASLSQELAQLGTAMQPLFRRLPNAKKALDKLTGGLVSAGMGALGSRIHRYRTVNLVDEAKQISDTSGMPLPAVFSTLVKQRRIDGLAVDALKIVQSVPDSDSTLKSDNEETTDRWFQTFYDEAGMVDESDVREVFLRILAGEITKPGSFSLRTLRIVGTISQKTARNFRRAASVRISTGFHVAGTHILADERIPAIGGGLGSNCLKDEGLTYSVLEDLMEHDLISTDLNSEFPYGVSIKLKPNSAHLTPVPATHQREQWLLTPKDLSKKAEGIMVGGVGFTSCGRELIDIVDTEAMPKFKDKLVAHLSELGLQVTPLSSHD